MKKIAYILAGLAMLGQMSCSDMLDVESSSQLTDEPIDEKTDSVFYAFGVMKAMQQLGDIYVLQNELRGDLVNTTTATDNNLRHLFNYSSTPSAYDSAYVYYRVINNVNYYLAKVDTALYDGSTNVIINQYAAMKAFRAWAYLQAVRQYGQVKYFTHPLTSISDVENDNSPMVGIDQLCSNLIQDLLPYTGYSVPSHGVIDCGSGNNSMAGSKTVNSWQCYIPVDVMLGELYLEKAAATGNSADYMQAAHYYYRYLDDKAAVATAMVNMDNYFFERGAERPQDFPLSVSTSPSTDNTYSWYGQTFVRGGSTEVISLIPFAQNSRKGTTTVLPSLYGHDYYTAYEDSLVSSSKVQLVASPNLNAISDSTDVYYMSAFATGVINYVRATDSRRTVCYEPGYRFVGGSNESYDSLFMTKFSTADVILYRTSTIWLHLAEALNGAGYPDAAFAILKSGLKPSLLTSADTLYLRPATRDMLTTEIPFCSSLQTNASTWESNVGIHSYGASWGDYPLSRFNSPYTLDSIVGARINRMAHEYEAIGLTANAAYDAALPASIGDSIFAVEELLCDEYAMEFAFEGSRFSDLTRMARAKNHRVASVSGQNTQLSYPANFGNLWFARKMAYKPNLEKDLTIESNWYLPFK